MDKETDEKESLLTKAGKAFDRLLDFFAVLAGIVAAFITVAVCAGIVTRFMFNRPMAWVIEISEYSLLYIAFLSAAWVMKNNKHVSVDLVYNSFSPKNKVISDLFTSILGGLVFLIVTYFGFKVTRNQYITKYFTPTFLEAPKFIVTLIIPVGSFLLLIQIIRKICRNFNLLIKGDFPQLKVKDAEAGFQVEP
jgi:TRAP-type C4-dicarboxylate transport system permease small subunit